MVQKFLRVWRPKLYGHLTKILYRGKNISFGANLMCDSIPKILIDPEAQVHIGSDVVLRRNVEIRCHKTSKIIIGQHVKLDRGVRVLAFNEAEINIADRARIGLYSVMNGGDSISVGEECLISGFVYLQTSMHGFKDRASIQSQGYEHAPVHLERDVWLGAHSVVLPGVTLGRGSVVGSNAVVTKSVDEFNVVGGVPAKKLKER